MSRYDVVASGPSDHPPTRLVDGTYGLARKYIEDRRSPHWDGPLWADDFTAVYKNIDAPAYDIDDVMVFAIKENRA